MRIKKLHEELKKLLYLEVSEDFDKTWFIDINLAVFLSHKIKDGPPIWLINVAGSGDGKSELLRSFRYFDEVRIVHGLTSKTLVNGHGDKKKFPDLAPELDNKIILILDLAQILKLPPSEKGLVWGQLRDLYDGNAGKDSGMGSRAKYSDLHVSFIANSTTAIDSQLLIHQDLGTRELYWRMPGNKDKHKLMNKILENSKNKQEIREELNRLILKFAENLEPKQVDIPKAVFEEIKALSIYISNMRAQGEFDYNNELRNDVMPEEPTRILEQLIKLYRCLMSLDKEYPSDRAMKILGHLGNSCCVPNRVKVFRFLKQMGVNEHSTSKVAEDCKIGKSTAKRELFILLNLDLARRNIEESENGRFTEKWSINPKSPFVRTGSKYV